MGRRDAPVVEEEEGRGESETETEAESREIGEIDPRPGGSGSSGSSGAGTSGGSAGDRDGRRGLATLATLARLADMSGDGAAGGWVPLEANPDVLNKYLERGGVVSGCRAVDVLGLEAEPLSWVPRPVVAVLLLFPCSERYEAHKRQEDQRLRDAPHHVSPRVFHMKQTVHNACGTVALLHCIANNAADIKLREGCWLSKFLRDAEGLDATARGSLLENCAGVVSTHLESAVEGQSAPPNADDPVYHHFVAFVHKDGHLYELDGRKSLPINHGVSSAATVLEDSARVCKEFMERDPTDVNFSVVALTASD